MESRQEVEEWDYQIRKMYAQQGLNSIRGIDTEDVYEHKGSNLFSDFLDVTRRCGINGNYALNSHKMIDELSLLSDSVMYFSACVYTFLPYINDPTEGRDLGWGTVYINEGNVHSKRYDMYVDTVFEKLYAYWNRVASTINYFLPVPLDEFKVNYAALIDRIPAQFHTNSGYIWLKAFKEKEFKSFNNYRKAIVHGVSTGNQFNHQHLNAGNDYPKLQQMMEERRSYPEMFKEHMALMKEGLFQLNILLREMDGAQYSHIQ